MTRRVFAALAVAGMLAGCASATREVARTLPAGMVPSALTPLKIVESLEAEKVWRHMPSGALITSGRVYTINNGATVEGDIQYAVFRRSVDTKYIADRYDRYCTLHHQSCSGIRALQGFQSFFGSRQFQRTYVSDQRVYTMQLSDQRVYLWFPPATQSYLLVIFRNAFGQANSDAVVAALVALEQGRPASPLTLQPDLIATPTSGAGMSPSPATIDIPPVVAPPTPAPASSQGVHG